MALIILPPGPMIVRIWSGLTLIVRDARRVLRELGARLGERLAHLAEDVQARLARLRRAPAPRSRAAGPAILMSIWMAVMPLRGAADLEVHVAEVVLVAEDVGEHGVLVALG